MSGDAQASMATWSATVTALWSPLSSLGWRLAVELLLLGACTGFLAGLLGIGGGMLLVPFIALVLGARGFPETHLLKTAVATSLATICFTSVSSLRAHHARGLVLWQVARRLTPGILIGALVGAQIAKALPTQALGLLFACFVAFSATQMLLDRKPPTSRQLPGTGGMVAVGGGIGLLSSLVGAGGAFVSVPFMTRCNVPIHQAVATSASLGLPIALAGTVGYVIAGLSLHDLPPGTAGFIYVPALLLVSLGSVCTAPLGAGTAHRLKVTQLRRVFAVMLYGLAVYMLQRSI